MPDPPGRRVVPLRKHLLHPLHDVRQFQPILRLDVKFQPVILKAQAPNPEDEPKHCLAEDRRKDRQCPGVAKEGFPVIDTGTDLVPHSLSKYTQLSHRRYYGIGLHIALPKLQKNAKSTKEATVNKLSKWDTKTVH
jgi:hypothetical protein